jgi:hypothetical protein
MKEITECVEPIYYVHYLTGEVLEIVLMKRTYEIDKMFVPAKRTMIRQYPLDNDSNKSLTPRDDLIV